MPSIQDKLVAGLQTTFKINFTPSADLGDPWPLANKALQNFPTFKTGGVKLDSVSTSGSQLLVTFTPTTSSVVTYGGLAQSIATYLNQQLAWGAYNFDASSVGAGLGNTSFVSQFDQAGGLTLSPFAPVTPGSGPSTFSLLLLGGAILLGLVLVKEIL